MTSDPVRVAADELWKAYLEVLPQSERQRDYFEAFQFGVGREMANQLARLVLDGIKTATSDLVWHLDFQHKPRWQVGDEHVVLDGFWTPVCVIRTTELEVKPFGEVDEAFARDYGEGDRSLRWWREHVFAWYARQCETMGLQASYDMPLQCERFEVVFAPGSMARI